MVTVSWFKSFIYIENTVYVWILQYLWFSPHLTLTWTWFCVLFPEVNVASVCFCDFVLCIALFCIFVVSQVNICFWAFFSAEFASLSATGSGSDRDGKKRAMHTWMFLSAISLCPFQILSVFTDVKFSLNMISFKSTQIYFNMYRYLDYFILDWNFSIWTCFFKILLQCYICWYHKGGTLHTPLTQNA